VGLQVLRCFRILWLEPLQLFKLSALSSLRNVWWSPNK
jgi:hypothetical protein